ncbi:MAG: SMC-Scp complex subunit ScpB [Candidatus Hydrogenedentes bacterium]|nr:SMC-Scp complex subunit ScpB [Candidatus Hydrogenedentota bacterium]
MHVAEEAIESEVNPTTDSDTFEPEPVESLNRDETRQAIFAMLFASDRPLSAGRIAEALGDADPDIVATMLSELKEEIDGGEAPIELREIAGGYQLTTEARYAPFIRRLFQIKKSNKLTKAVLETLAIIAYRQPVTRPDVESIRGVSVSHAFSQLQERRLIKAVGVSDTPGRPRLYRTTDEFLVHFGINHLNELPSIDELQTLR